MNWSLSLVLVGAITGLAACNGGADGGAGGDAPAAPIDREVFVAHFLSDCTGVGPQKCLNVRGGDDEEWTLRYDPIEGFEYEPGYEYRLIVSETVVEDPPADGSSLRWTLVEEVSKTRFAEGDGSGNPMLQAWALQGFGPAADLGDASTTAEVRAALAGLPEDKPVTLGLAEEGRAAGFSGCNRYFGDFRIENGHQIRQGPKGATMMACPGGQMDLEQAFLRNLDASTRAFLRDGGLQLENDEGVLLTFVPWNSAE